MEEDIDYNAGEEPFQPLSGAGHHQRQIIIYQQKDAKRLLANIRGL